MPVFLSQCDRNLPGFGCVEVTGQHLTMEINSVVIVEELERSDHKLLEISCLIVAVIQGRIAWASVGKKLT